MLRRASLSAPVALLLAATGCSSADPPRPTLTSAFPDEASAITNTGRHFEATTDSFVLTPGGDRWGPSRLAVQLPQLAQKPVRMRLDAVNVAFDVYELDVHGKAAREGDAIRYARQGGVSYWAGVPGGVEEWLVLEQGVPSYDVPVASWIVSGATLVEAGPAVLVYDGEGKPRVRVTADKAFGPDGESLGTALRVVGDRLDLYVAQSPGPVLVDPLWADQTNLVERRMLHAAALLQDGRVLVSGGIGATGMNPPGPTDSAELYDSTANTWTVTNDMFTERVGHTLTALDDGTAIAHGGEDGFGMSAAMEADIFDPMLAAGVGDWGSSGYGYCYTAGYHTATKLADGNVLFTGGLQDGIGSGTFGGVLNAPAERCVEIWDTSFEDYDLPGFGSGQFELNQSRAAHAAVKLNNDDVLITGGEHWGSPTASTEVYDYNGTDEFSYDAFMNYARSGHTATLLCNGDVLVAGGITEIPEANGLGGPFGQVLDTAEVYDHDDMPSPTWNETTNTLNTGRFGHTANRLPDCTVLIVGGFDDMGNALNSAEIYDPGTDTWSMAPAIPSARGDATGTTLANGDILVTSGFDGNMDAVADSWEYQSRILGDPCTADAQCNSGFCADGVCCDTSCDSPCESCTDSLKDNADGDGTCGGTATGTDPDNECADAGLATCGTNGACDGTPGRCAVYAAGTVCNPSACGTDDVVEADTCNGDVNSPACEDGGITDCGAYTCSAATCLTSCATVADCAGDHYCDDSTATCQPQKPNGDPADDSEQCLSGILADGVCCDAACNNGVCDACTAALGASADGTCTDIVTCTDDNACTIDACHPVNGCVSNNVLDGAACEGGICVAGTCIPDPELVSSGSDGLMTGTGSGGSGGTGSTGAAGDLQGDPRLEGGGICQLTVAGGPAKEKEQLPWLLLGLAPLLRRRRKRS